MKKKWVGRWGGNFQHPKPSFTHNVVLFQAHKGEREEGGGGRGGRYNGTIGLI